MKVKRIIAREIRMRLSSPFETSFGIIRDRRIILLEVETQDAVGWSEVAAAEGPFYNSENTDTAWLMLRQYLSPMVIGKTFADPGEIARAMEPIRGQEMAKAALENAVWDAVANEKGVSLSSMLGGTQKDLSCGVSLGIHSDIGALLDDIAIELSRGYQRIKLKIKPGRDVSVIRDVRKKYPEISLTVDANSAYTLGDVLLLKQLDEFNLSYIEQPLHWNGIYQHAQLQRQLHTPICLDECIRNLRDAQAAIQLGACKVINIKLGRTSGHTEARLIHDYCLENSVPVWCGGMLESGVGRAHNIAMASLPGFVLPGDVSASRRYWERDVISPEVVVNAFGKTCVPDRPGIGFEVNRGLVEDLTVHSEGWLANGRVAG